AVRHSCDCRTHRVITCAYRSAHASLICRRMRLVVIVVLLAQIAHAQSITTGAIAGVVTDAKTGEPLAGVTVTLVGGQGAADTAITEIDGSYKITGLVPGTYEVTFWYAPA